MELNDNILEKLYILQNELAVMSPNFTYGNDNRDTLLDQLIHEIDDYDKFDIMSSYQLKCWNNVYRNMVEYKNKA